MNYIEEIKNIFCLLKEKGFNSETIEKNLVKLESNKSMQELILTEIGVTLLPYTDILSRNDYDFLNDNKLNLYYPELSLYLFKNWKSFSTREKRKIFRSIKKIYNLYISKT